MISDDYNHSLADVFSMLPSVFLIFQQKLEERTAVLCKGKFSNPKDRERWEKVLCLDLMSSEESGFDDGDEILITRPLPWRSPRVDQLFKELDKHSLSEKSPQARRQMKHRSVGNPSTRPCCVRDGVPEWAFSN